MSEEDKIEPFEKKDSVIRDFDPTKGRKKKDMQPEITSPLKIPKEEQEVIFQLEKIIGRPLPKVNHVMWGQSTNPKHQIGYVIENGHVIEIGLCPRVRGSFINTFFQLKTVPDSLQNLKFLRVLDLSSNGLSAIQTNSASKGLDILPEWFGNLRTLTELNLSWNKLTYLPESFGNLESLKILHLYQNKIYKLPRSFGNLKNLEELYLSQNDIDSIPMEFEGLKSLYSLDFQGNKLSEIPESFCSLQSLQFLSLAENNIEYIPDNFHQLESLRELSLAENHIKILPESFSRLKSLKSVTLFKNSISILPENIGSLTSLIELDIRENEIMNLPKSFAHLTSLESFLFENNPWNQDFSIILKNPLKKLLEILRKRAGLSVFIINEFSDITQYLLHELVIDLEGDQIFQVEFSNPSMIKEEFEELIRQSDKILFLITLKSMKSRTSRNLLDIAIKNGKKIIVLLGKDVSIENLAILGLDREEYIELNKIEKNERAEMIYNKICNITSILEEYSVTSSIIDTEISAFKIKTSIRNIVDSKEFMNFLGSKIEKNEINPSMFDGKHRDVVNKLINLLDSYIKFNKNK